jgi:opacity protein-like surface antigen
MGGDAALREGWLRLCRYLNNGVGQFQFDGGRDSYTIGGGLEYMFAPSWSAKIEYQYYDFDRRDLFVGAPLVLAGGAREAEHTAKVGLNYRFSSLPSFNPFSSRY